MEEKITKIRAKELVEIHIIHTFEVGTFKGLPQIHHYLFQDICDFAGEIRSVDIAKRQFRFSSLFFSDFERN